MSDEWMPSLRLRLSLEEFEQLPRHAAYKYAYVDGRAIVSPWPRHLHAVLDLEARRQRERAADSTGYQVRRLARADEPALVELFAAAFQRVQPFGGLNEATLRSAAERCLQRTFSGADGPWVADASFVVQMPAQSCLSGAILITLVPGGDPAAGNSYRWDEPAQADLWQHGAGQPHLTWIFVSPWQRGHGLGALLLDRAADLLRQRGYSSLWTTFLVGNDVSTLWHWRNGFRLAEAPPPHGPAVRG